MNPARLRTFRRLLSRNAALRQTRTAARRRPAGIYVPTSPASIALAEAEERRYADERWASNRVFGLREPSFLRADAGAAENETLAPLGLETDADGRVVLTDAKK